MVSAPVGEVIPRHLMFVLEDGETVIQRGANLVEVLRTGEWRVFGDYERDHNITDEELRQLQRETLLEGFDETTIWLSMRRKSDSAKYYFLDTHLSPPYLELVKNLLYFTNQNYAARVRQGRVAIVGVGGEPFSSLADAESAHTLLSPAFKEDNILLSVDSVNLELLMEEDTNDPDDRFERLIHETPTRTASLSDCMILVVENDPELADHYTLALQNLGVEVRVAHTGETALQIALDEEPDLVLINLMLPDMHGYEVIAKLRKDPLTDQTAIIVISDVSSQQDVVFALNVAKVDDFLVKPLGPKILRKRILGILMQKQW